MIYLLRILNYSECHECLFPKITGSKQQTQAIMPYEQFQLAVTRKAGTVQSQQLFEVLWTAVMKDTIEMPYRNVIPLYPAILGINYN